MSSHVVRLTYFIAYCCKCPADDRFGFNDIKG